MVAWNITIVYYNLAQVKKSENYSCYGMQQQQFSKKEQHASIYSCNKITTTQIQISRQKWNVFFSNIIHEMMI